MESLEVALKSADTALFWAMRDIAGIDKIGNIEDAAAWAAKVAEIACAIVQADAAARTQQRLEEQRSLYKALHEAKERGRVLHNLTF